MDQNNERTHNQLNLERRVGGVNFIQQDGGVKENLKYVELQ